jgi:phage shock protein A
MKINEVIKIPQTYLATVRVVLRDSSMTARTTITADSLQQARAMLTRIYGASNVLNITLAMNEDGDVTESTKTLSPQELQVKALADKAEDYKQQEKALKARQQMAKAQQNLMKASRGFSASNKR